MEPLVEAKISKRYFSHCFHLISTNCMINMVVMKEYRLLLILAICQKLQIWWHFEIFLKIGPCMAIEISKGYFS